MKKIFRSFVCIVFSCMIFLMGCGNKDSDIEVIDDNYRNYYEIFVRSYADSNGDDIGDLNGVSEKLDYISDMGFTGIWLMPIMESTTYHKYDVVDYMSIDPEYGNLDDFKNLVENCHEHDIKIIIDLAMNHTSSKHEWFLTAVDYIKGLGDDEDIDTSKCKYAGYYNFSKEKEDGSWVNIDGTSWYYEAVFWSEMPDLNLKNSDVQKEFEDIAKFWIDMGVDGFRMDAAMHYEEADYETNNEILNNFYNYCLGLDDDFYMVSEVWSDKSTIANYYKSMTPSFFNFPVSSTDGILEKVAMGTAKASSYVNTMLDDEKVYGESNPDFIDAPFLTNHDQTRVCNNLRSDLNDLKMAAGLLLTMPGNTFVYYGEEIGMKSSGTKDENKRLAFIWSEDEDSYMCKDPDDADEVEQVFPALDEQLLDETSLANYYKDALYLRNKYPVIARGDVQNVEDITNDTIAATIRTYEDDKIAILYNTSDENMDVDMTGTDIEGYKLVDSLLISDGEVLQDGDVMTLPAQSICILK